MAIIMSKMIINQEEFGVLMHRIGFPIPLIFKVPNPNQLIQYYQPKLLTKILRTKDFNIVTNVGSAGVVGKGKTIFIKELYYLKKKYLNT